MRVDYRKVFPGGMLRLAAGLRSDVTSLDGLDLPDGADGSRSA